MPPRPAAKPLNRIAVFQHPDPNSGYNLPQRLLVVAISA
jgi:hypothetical protein